LLDAYFSALKGYRGGMRFARKGRRGFELGKAFIKIYIRLYSQEIENKMSRFYIPALSFLLSITFS
jgi:hypothetical protein